MLRCCVELEYSTQPFCDRNRYRFVLGSAVPVKQVDIIHLQPWMARYYSFLLCFFGYRWNIDIAIITSKFACFVDYQSLLSHLPGGPRPWGLRHFQLGNHPMHRAGLGGTQTIKNGRFHGHVTLW